MARALTPEAEEAILESVRNGTPFGKAAATNGYSKDQIYIWRQMASHNLTHDRSSGRPYSPWYIARVKDFIARAELAEASTVTIITNQLFRMAHSSAFAADRWLSKHPASRDDWFEHREQHSTTSVQLVPVAYERVRTLTTEQLLELADPDPST